ncbi:PREDICTED: transcription factor EMB1444-like isoform X2 [Lupinus angustifolius]|uniref:transcription factor EMB1444-like isoform X2 n=1 Tax=Lupinus angustifolius TaxID=3871 RepID=UPI00092F7AD5|nr:PREDICTED: transcription factor EMB1444-like isoform X2 [Lupinus angustifolius]
MEARCMFLKLLLVVFCVSAILLFFVAKFWKIQQMEATSITQFLKSLCYDTQWKYVVFWKLNHHFPMTLTWENGYYGYQKTNEAMENLGGVLNFKSQDWIYSSRGDITDGSDDYSCRLLMTEMSHLKYSLGEGVVGKIALSGDHCWIFCEDLLTNNFDTNLIPECPDEWLVQFASGIKTIVLVPVLPHGVLQFGSFVTVVEDPRFIANVKDKFQSIYCQQANAEPLNLGMNIQDWSFSATTDTIMDSLDESSITNSMLKGEVSGCTTLDVNGSTRLNPTMPPFIQDECFMSQENETKTNHLEEEMWACFQWGNDVGLLGETSNGSGSYSGKSTAQQQFGGTEAGHNDVENVNDFFTFPSESELHKALGSSVAYRQTDKSLSKHIRAEDTYSSSTLLPNKEQHDHINGFEFPNEVDPEYLLDAVFSNLCSASDDTSSVSNSVRSPVTMPMKFTSSLQPNINSEESDLIVRNSDVESNLMSAGTVKAIDGFTNHFTSPSFYGNSSILRDEARGEKVYSHMHQPISGPKVFSKSKKRAKVDNSQRSRPRDRQMIMDRMKELRELVPDGGRCSIDNLLERTINHMVYLRKITSQAEKLKRFAHREVPKCNKQKIKGSHPGRICAIDFESELPWPIVIEDLDSSGHMLIEMICNEHGLFLEIAQVIQEMNLTILKGALEERPSTAWARFIVEVPRGFHRMDVLCPLLHLLQLRRIPQA